MKKVFECSTCGIVTEQKWHLCTPVEVELQDYCGQPAGKKTARMCSGETTRLEYQCRKCGRTAEQPELVCAPDKVNP